MQEFLRSLIRAAIIAAIGRVIATVCNMTGSEPLSVFSLLVAGYCIGYLEGREE